MSGSNPKYLPIPKKVPYNIRLPKTLLDKINAYAELTGKTTTDVVIGALNELVKDKTVTNDYLTNMDGVVIEIPMLYSEKDFFYNSNLLDGVVYSSYDSYGDTIDVKAKSEPYEILKIPNNMDRFNETFGYYSMIDSVGVKGNHTGIEFVILPDSYSYRGNTDVFDALYCFYFEVKRNKLTKVVLMNYLDAINELNNTNGRIKNNLVLCVKDLTKLKKDIEDEFTADEIKEEEIGMIELIALSKKYNTGNIIPLGDNIADEIVDVEFTENPEYFDIFMNDIKDNTEKYVDDIIADRVADIVDFRLQNIEKLVRNAKSKDDIQNAINENLRITLK